MYGHILEMANTIKDAVEANGCEVKMAQVPETLPDEVLQKMGAPPKAEHPIATPDDLEEADGILFGIPTRFGMAAAQMKAFIDSTGSQWQKQSLSGKPAGIFFSSATQSGGQETTALTFVTQLTHHGMVFVPAGYCTPTFFDMSEIHGGSPYGAGTYAGPDGSRKPTANEKTIATAQGENFAKFVTKLHKGSN